MAKMKKSKKLMPPMDHASYKPEISFDARELKAIKNWKVGGKYKLALSVEMTSQSKDQYDGENAVMRGRFKVLSVKVLGGRKSGRAPGNPKVEAEQSDENTKYGY